MKMILLLTILYALGAFVTMVFNAVNINLSGTGIAPDYYGPFSKWLFTYTIKGGFVGNAVIIGNLLLWPITLPLFALKK
jgi:hypothetical protein